LDRAVRWRKRRCAGLCVVSIEGGRATDREVRRQRSCSYTSSREGVDQVGCAIFCGGSRSNCHRHIRIVVSDCSGSRPGHADVIAGTRYHIYYSRLVRLDWGIRRRVNSQRCCRTTDGNRQCAIGPIERGGTRERVISASRAFRNRDRSDDK